MSNKKDKRLFDPKAFAIVVMIYLASAYFIREKSISLGLDVCMKRNSNSVNCQCIGNVIRQESPLYSFWYDKIFSDDKEKEQRINITARGCAK